MLPDGFRIKGTGDNYATHNIADPSSASIFSIITIGPWELFPEDCLKLY